MGQKGRAGMQDQDPKPKQLTEFKLGLAGLQGEWGALPRSKNIRLALFLAPNLHFWTVE